MSLIEQLAEVRASIVEAAIRSGRAADSVQLVAVSKLQSLDKLRAAHQAGQRIFGENYVQELEQKRAAFVAEGLQAEWHLIGHLQSNKAKKAAPLAALFHAIDSEKTARALAQAGARRILLEVNLGGESSKAGVGPDSVEALIDRIRREAPALEIAGLMCIPPPQTGRAPFAALRELRDRLVLRTGLPLSELSMGMSDDFALAILEGATLVRVGTRIFGPRGV